MDASKISIIIPVYKRIELLERCLNSCENSTLKPFEIIVVDDGNDSADIVTLKKIVQKFGVRLLQLPSNNGAPVARNLGARVATGEFLFFADADIEICFDGLAQLANALQKNPDAAFAYGNFMFGEQEMRGQVFSVDVLKQRNFISTMTLIRAENFIGFDPKLKRFQDWDLWLTLAEHGKYGVYVDKKIFVAHPGGSMSTWLPSIVIKYARFFSWIPAVHSYVRARAVIFEKHHLST
ncbi:MAG: glycosyltransferase family A protein [Candidatus Magasanikbacteria bacterium]|nr:glycosyltransferase family A protein [Candidatus Magasanikbacteria bacterium]